MGKQKSTEVITLSTGLQIKVRKGWKDVIYKHQYTLMITALALGLGITLAGVKNINAEAESEPIQIVNIEPTTELAQPLEISTEVATEIELPEATGEIIELKAEPEPVIVYEDTKPIEIKADVIEYEYNPRYDTESDLYVLAHLINAEAGATYCSDTMRYYVGSVVLNRVASSDFPNTIKGVVYDNTFGVQYACTIDGNFEKEPEEYCWEIAEDLLTNGSVLPETVVFQAQFEQGSGTYAVEQNMYFCYE